MWLYFLRLRGITGKVYEKRRISQSTNSAASSASFSGFCAYYDIVLHCACCKWKG